MEYAECDTCGRGFYAKGEWQRSCFGCFMKTPKGQAWASRKANEQQAQQNNPYRGFNENAYSGGNAYGQGQRNAGDDWFDEVFRRHQEYQRQQRAQSPPRSSNTSLGIDRDFMRKLLMLCHPDKHGNSELSNAVTAELLKMRERLK